MTRSRNGYRRCRVCNKERHLKTGFYWRKRKSGLIVYDYTCKKCRTAEFLQRYNRVKTLIKELSAEEYPADYMQEQECSECVFLVECNYMVKIKKSLINPYCFEDSMSHHRYLKQYGKGIT